MTTLVELCAGTAALSLHALAGLAPITGYMGSKAQDAIALRRVLLDGQRPDRVVLVDGGPWGDVWAVLGLARHRREVAAVLMGWHAQGDLVEVWPRLVQMSPSDDPAERVAQYLALQARVSTCLPVWWDGVQWVSGDERGAQQKRPNNKPGSGGLNRIATLAERLESLDRIDWSRVTVIHGDVRDVEPAPGSLVYPPYHGCPRYACLLPRADVLAVAERHAEVAGLVVVSEAEPLPLDGWCHARLRDRGKPEWLTMSRPVPDARLPAAARQMHLGAA